MTKPNRENESRICMGYVQERLHYDPETGIFTWKQAARRWFRSERAWKHFNKRYAGTVAGCVSRETGYRRIMLLDLFYFAHRLAFVYMTGEWPKQIVDHKDRNRDNNAWDNLRETSTAINARNVSVSTRNTSGRIGVASMSDGLFEASITVNGRQIVLGRKLSFEEAVNLRARAEDQFGYSLGHGGQKRWQARERRINYPETRSPSKPRRCKRAE